MKTHKCNLLKKGVLVVEIAEGISQMRKNTMSVLNHDGYTLLGKPDEIKEEDVRELVDEWNGIFIDHVTDEPEFYTALESFFSAIESEIFWDVNPYPLGIYAMTPTGIKDTGYDDWQAAQSRTFDRQRSIIFIEN